ncbi:hypothetical protein Ndes2437B_g03851 [Nannochloris sp. 'desiccata']
MMPTFQFRAAGFQQFEMAPTKMAYPKPAQMVTMKASRTSQFTSRPSKAHAGMLQEMTTKEYKYEDPSKDLEKVIELIQCQNAFLVDDILSVVKNAVTRATLQFRKVTTAVRAAEVLSLLEEPVNEEQAARLRAAANQVANAIDSTFQLDRKAVNHSELVAFFVSVERACPTIGNTLIRRRGLAFAGRFKELVRYVGRRSMTASQACVLFCILDKLAADGRLVTNSREMAFLAAKIEDGCGKLSAAEMKAVAHHARHISSAQVSAMLQAIAIEVIHRSAFETASAKRYEVVLKTVLLAVDENSGRRAAACFKKGIKKWKAEQEAAAQAEKERIFKEFTYSAACTVINFLSAAKYLND